MEKNGNRDRLYFPGLQITADGDCSHDIKRHLLLGRKAMTNLDSILKSRDITLPTKIRLIKAMVFPVAMYRCERWPIKKAEHQRTNVFKLWCWRRLLRVPWTARRTNQSILKEINPECLLEGLMLKLKLHYFGPPDAKSQLTGKDLDAGRDWGQEEKGTTEDEMVGWHYLLNEHEFEQTLGDGQGSLAYCSPWSHKESDTTEQLKSNNNQHIMLKQRVLPVLLRTTQGQFVHLGCGATQPLAITYDVPVHCSLKTASITPRLITPKSSPTST